jgi:uncharacterized protein YbjT (DUF2867 family)
MEKTRVLVVGAAGWLSHQIAADLLDGGKAVVRALIRSGGPTAEKANRVEDLRSGGMTITQGDLADTSSLSKACEGIPR